MKAEWDPEQLDAITPTKDCLKRIKTDLTDLRRNPLQGIYCFLDDTIVTKCHGLIVGPFDTPYEGGFFYFIINFPENYPQEPPRVKLMTTGGGRVRFNPNLYANGKVCLSILGTWSGPSWSSVQSLGSVMLSIQSLMNENPYHNEPGFEATNIYASKNYNDCIRHETLRIAVCEMVDPTSSLHQSLPEPFQEIISALYPNFVDGYKITCESNLVKDGQKMVDPFGEDRGSFNFAGISRRLDSINSSLGIEVGDEDEDDIEDDGESHQNCGAATEN